MRVRVTPGARVGGEAVVPGDKSIAHRWLLLAATARGRSRIGGLPRALDTASTATCLARLVPSIRPAVEAWASAPPATRERNGSTWDRNGPTLDPDLLEIEGAGRGSLVEPAQSLDCGNSATTMRLLAGLVASASFTTVLAGDHSLSRRPMERVARPLRRMGADVRTHDGGPPVTVRGSDRLHGLRFEPDIPSAQVKGAVLLAALAAHGETSVVERIPTRDHTERALGALGAAVRVAGSATGAAREVVLDGPTEHHGFEGIVPGDPSSAAFLIGAAALSGAALTVAGVGLNPSRLRFLDVAARMGVTVETEVEEERVGEPVGTMRVRPPDGLRPAQVGPDELPLVIDEIPVLAALAAHADGGSRFEGGAELRVKESDRLAALLDGIRALGGAATVEGDALIVTGGGLDGGTADGRGDHRIAMALVVAALGARGPSEIEGIGAAAVSFPGFLGLLASLGADLEASS